MDAFGIGAAIKGMALIYFQGARQTGRTVAMLESLRDDDRVIFANREECFRVEKLAKERKLKIECIVCQLHRLPDLFSGRPTSKGRTVFDHGWIEKFYLLRLENCRKEIDHLQRELSGFGEAHFKTKLAAQQIERWEI